MKISTLFGQTLREAPVEAEHPAHQWVLRAGLARALLAGGYAMLPLGMAVLRRIEAIVHEEMAWIGAQELRTPIIQSSDAWEQTGRYEAYGPVMLRLEDRSGRSLIIAPTHEEAIAQLARREITSYRQMPALVYQTHTKYRDEIRAKGGLMRMREFTMLDAYSLDQDAAGLDRSYDLLAGAFERIFDRCALSVVAVEAATGEMGGREAREYMVASSAGEDTLVLCDSCGYAANLEVAVSAAPGSVTSRNTATMEPVETPDCTTIAGLAHFLGIPESGTAKAVFFDTPERGLLFAVIRGDREVNEDKLRALAGVSALTPATAERIAAVGAVAGYASPIGLDRVPIIADRSVVGADPLVSGANREGYHLRNVLYGRDWQASEVGDIATVAEGEPCARCGAPLRYERAVEIGHIFKLGTRYTEALDATFLDSTGASQPIVMGSYGIGLERLLQLVVEQHHDERGIIWPASIAPLDVQLLRIGKSDAVRASADALYTELSSSGLRVLYDDRDETAGVKFNDADLIGLPLRVVVSERLLGDSAIELKPRSGEARRVARSEAVSAIGGYLRDTSSSA